MTRTKPDKTGQRPCRDISGQKNPPTGGIFVQRPGVRPCPGNATAWPTDTPEVTTVADLCAQWRLIARQPIVVLPPAGYRARASRMSIPLVWHWCGSMADPAEQRQFQAARRRGQIVTVQRRHDGEFLLYAKLASAEPARRPTRRRAA